jgi:uncharacterized membrane protein
LSEQAGDQRSVRHELRRRVAAVALSAVLLARAGASLIFLAAGGNRYTNQTARPTLVAISAVATLVALISVILSASSCRHARRSAPWRALKGLWLLSLLLLLLEWTLGLASSG